MVGHCQSSGVGSDAKTAGATAPFWQQDQPKLHFWALFISTFILCYLGSTRS